MPPNLRSIKSHQKPPRPPYVSKVSQWQQCISSRWRKHCPSPQLLDLRRRSVLETWEVCPTSPSLAWCMLGPISTAITGKKNLLVFQPLCLLPGFLKAALWKLLRDREAGGGLCLLCADTDTHCYCPGFASSCVCKGTSSLKLSSSCSENPWSCCPSPLHCPAREGTWRLLWICPCATQLLQGEQRGFQATFTKLSSIYWKQKRFCGKARPQGMNTQAVHPGNQAPSPCWVGSPDNRSWPSSSLPPSPYFTESPSRNWDQSFDPLFATATRAGRRAHVSQPRGGGMNLQRFLSQERAWIAPPPALSCAPPQKFRNNSCQPACQNP